MLMLVLIFRCSDVLMFWFPSAPFLFLGVCMFVCDRKMKLILQIVGFFKQ